MLVQVQEALQTLKEECSTAAQQQGVVLRSNMDQIISSRAFLETKLQGEIDFSSLFLYLGVCECMSFECL